MRVAGFGYREGASVAALIDAYAQAGNADVVATAADKDSPLAQSFAQATGLPLILITPSTIALQPATLSPHAPTRYGGRSLAEGAALAAAGPDARLVVPRVASADGMATVAIAEGAGQ
jgi:cobalt-precorrin 5A hydrolase